MIEAAAKDEYAEKFRTYLIQTETFLERSHPQLDALIELSGLLSGMGAFLHELRADYPQDHRLALLVARCETNHEEVIERAEAAAKRERAFAGASLH